MARYGYALPRRARRFRSPYGRRNSGPGAFVGIAAGIALASAVAAKGAVIVHPHAKAHAQPATVAVASGSEAAFIAAVLAGLGAPATAANKQSLAAWFPREFPSWPPRAASNPMSSTLPMPGSWAYNTLADGLHVQNYPSAAEGAQATALTLEGGNWYPHIVAALRSGAGLCGNQSITGELLTWSGSGYSEVC